MNSMMRYTLITVSILLFSCKTPTIDSNKTNIETAEYEVKYFGALRNMMHKGDISAQVGLSDFENTAHLYALGALENLKGEIQIIDGKPYNTSVKDSSILFDSSFDKKATLLVYATVKEWNTYMIPKDISTYEQLEKHIALTAKANGIDISEPFPFMMEGLASSFDWHVINWKDGDMEHSHEKHVNSGLHGTIENREVDLLGFYSDSHHAIFTHHTTNMHIHVKTSDNKIAGHVDGLILGKGMILKLPSVK
jgi:acetolactate decarboxylase